MFLYSLLFCALFVILNEMSHIYHGVPSALYIQI